MANFRCPLCNSTQAQTAHAIHMRLGQNPSFAALWERLDQAERDRDRMLNALTVIRDSIKPDGTVSARTKSVIGNAIRKVAATRTPKPPQHG